MYAIRSYYGMRKLEEENRKLQVKIEDIRMIDRAKYVLMEFLKMNEAQAHRYIEKQRNNFV